MVYQHVLAVCTIWSKINGHQVLVSTAVMFLSGFLNLKLSASEEHFGVCVCVRVSPLPTRFLMTTAILAGWKYSYDGHSRSQPTGTNGWLIINVLLLSEEQTNRQIET